MIYALLACVAFTASAQTHSGAPGANPLALAMDMDNRANSLLELQLRFSKNWSAELGDLAMKEGAELDLLSAEAEKALEHVRADGPMSTYLTRSTPHHIAMLGRCGIAARLELANAQREYARVLVRELAFRAGGPPLPGEPGKSRRLIREARDKAKLRHALCVSGAAKT